MSRSLKKWYYVDEKLLAKVIACDINRSVKTWSRRSVIFPEMIWKRVEVHNWKSFILVYITDNMVWHKLWEFAPTRTFRWHAWAKK